MKSAESSSSSISISGQQEQRKSGLESSESSSSTLDECGWLPLPEQTDGSAKEAEIKDDGSDIAVVPLYGDDEFSFLPWPDTPKNGRATAA